MVKIHVKAEVMDRWIDEWYEQRSQDTITFKGYIWTRYQVRNLENWDNNGCELLFLNKEAAILFVLKHG